MHQAGSIFSMFPLLLCYTDFSFRSSNEIVRQGERPGTSSSKSKGVKGKVGPLLVTNPFTP